ITVGYNVPDSTDDTAELVIALAKTDRVRYAKNLRRATDWIIQMQNADGGWGAFDRNNNGSALLEHFVREFQDSADLFDDSSADVTGHVLEALADSGLLSSSSEEEIQDSIDSAVEYLKDTQDPKTFAWKGRWGVNFIYGTSAAIVGLLKVGESPASPYIKKSLDWLESLQNPDGGFGETTASYNVASRAGRGLSTPSQTAWVLQALLEGGRGQSLATQKAVQYLIESFQRDGRWIDHSVVGTGHPSVVYLEYPSYPYAFPLMALGKYLRLE
ncbi:MAG: prenyltransferase/squalene oxidase repeat-containing protein, partial [Pseudomonadota bacterium]